MLQPEPPDEGPVSVAGTMICDLVAVAMIIAVIVILNSVSWKMWEILFR